MSAGADRGRRLEELFRLASELPAADHEGFLARHCPDDAELAAELRALLEQDAAGTGSLLRRGAWTPVRADAERVGPYRLIELLGEGGMGTVHLAEQEEPIRREVALKRVRLGLLTDEIAARFDSERDALARMSHPGIASIYDAGVTDTGVPYFVMEYVPGPPLLAYCELRRLDLAARLRLFVDVCDAVQHAHQKGVVHRDLKPSNVLVREVDGVPVPKVIDFGVARAVSGPLAGGATLTQGRPVGTLAYMSPEQADPRRWGEVDTRTDVYSLGVVLYELATGRRPFDAERLQERGMLEAVRILSEEEPVRPSRRGDTTTGLRLPDDFDWVVAKAMEKDRVRRYASVSELAADVRRLLAHDPVHAGPPSATYRARRFVQRHPVALLLGSLLALSLAGGVVVSTSEMVRARRAEARARAARAEAARQRTRMRAVVLAFEQGLSLPGNRAITPTELVDRMAAHVDAPLEPPPAEEAAVRTALGRVYLAQGADARARDELLRALTILDALEDSSAHDEFETLEALVQAVRRVDGLEAARPYADRALALASAELVGDDPALAAALEAVRLQAVDGEAQRRLHAALDGFPLAPHQGDDVFVTGRALIEVGAQLVLAGDAWAGEYLARLEARARDLVSADDARFPPFLWSLTNAHLVPGHELPAEARRLAEELGERARQSLPPGHWLRLDARRLLGLAHAAAGELEAAEELLVAARDAVEALPGPPSSRQRAAGRGIDGLLARVERDGGGEAFLAAALERWRADGAAGVWWPLSVRAPTVEATRLLERVLEPVGSAALAGMLCVRQGRLEDALARLDGERSAAEALFRLLALARAGERERARAELDALRPRLASGTGAPLAPGLGGLLEEVEAAL